MKVAIHQPNYFPWLGYFFKISVADVFVFHDRVPFSRTSYTRRCAIPEAKSSIESTWLSVPVQKASTDTPISEIKIDSSKNWRAKHLRKMTNAYTNAPYIDEIQELIRNLYDELSSEVYLGALNQHVIKALCSRLGISATFIASSELDVSGQRSELNLDIVSKLNGQYYISGTGALNYEEQQAFDARQIEVVMLDAYSWLEENQYERGGETFMNGLSIIDVLMYHGFEGTRTLIYKYQEKLKADG